MAITTKLVAIPESQARFLRNLRGDAITLQTRLEGALQLAAVSAGVTAGSVSLNEEGTHLSVALPEELPAMIVNQPDPTKE